MARPHESTMNWITHQIATSGAEISPDNWHEIVDKEKITAVVNLRAEHQDHFAPPPPVAYLWLPVEDFTNPLPAQLLIGSHFIDAAVRSDQRVLIHCKLGIGRAPTMAAAYFVYSGISIEEAIRRVEDAPQQRYAPVISRTALGEFFAFLSGSEREMTD